MLLETSDIAQIIAPLSSDRPCGAAARYEPEYEAIEAEVSKQESLSQRSVDWDQVTRLASQILKEKSKDLLLATYLTYGLFLKEGYQGLERGLTIYDHLLSDYWDDLYPEKKRLRGRIAAVEWLAEKLEKAIVAAKPISAEKESLSGCLTRWASIDQNIHEKLQGKAPNLGKILTALKQYQNDFERNTPPQASKPTQPAPSAAAGITEVTTSSDIPKALKQAQELFKQVAAFVRESNLADPRSYRMTRTAAWLVVDQIPPNDNGVTQIPPVQKDAIAKYEGYLEAGDFATLIQEVELHVIRAPFWLDAHRLVVAALDGLGAQYSGARKAVIDEVAGFTRRLPEVVNLKFFDELPFADEKTRLWLDSEVAMAPSDVHQSVAPPGHAEDMPDWEATLTDARRLAAQGKFGEGLNLFRERSQQAQSQRSEFLWRMNQSRYCYETGYVDMATPQLEYLQATAIDINLAEWEPSLSVSVMELLLLCYEKAGAKSKKAGTKLRQRTGDVYARLCLVDVNAAFRLHEQPWLKKAIQLDSD